MNIHEVCSIFPMMSPGEFEGLKADIQANGQREPIWTYQGKVIDGRNRLKACEEIGREPRFREWDGKGSLVEFVVSLNLHRRHLTSGQKAAVGTEVEGRLAIEAKERQRAGGREKVKQRIAEPIPQPQARDQAAKLVGTNHTYIQDAKTVKAASPELHEKVKNGTMTLPQAKREVARTEKRVALAEAAKAIASNGQNGSPWEIREGDCLNVLETIEPGSVRLIFADPPYNIGIDYGGGKKVDQLPEAEYLAWCAQWLGLCYKALTADGSLWLLINHENAAALELMLRGPFVVRSRITWYEAFGVNCSNNFNRCSRRLFVCVKDPNRFVFNADAVSRPSDRQVKYNDTRADPGGKLWDDVWGINPPIPRLCGTAKERIPDFPTQLPLGLLLPVVGCASEPGDLVLDPFSGSATTGVASIQLGRRYLGIEKSDKFAALSRHRLTATKKEDDAYPPQRA